MSNPQIISIEYFLLDTQCTFMVSISNHLSINELKGQIKSEFAGRLAKVGPAELKLYLVDIPHKNFFKELEHLQLNAEDRVRFGSIQLSEVFPEGPKPGTVHIIVQAPGRGF
jgi:hypothetical protein